MKLQAKKIIYSTEIHTCKTCNHSFKGKVCNVCGEKVFTEKQLSSKHFFDEAIDFFWHWESKVLKTIKLNFLKPGFVTKQNINGIRIPYAKPIQLYLVVAFAFFIVVSKIEVKDYIPSIGDHKYYFLSDYRFLKWAKPLDKWFENGIDSMWVKKGIALQKELEITTAKDFIHHNQLVLSGRGNLDSVVLATDKLAVISFRQMVELRYRMFNANVGTFSKTLIFVLLPFFAAFFFLFFFKKIKYYGAALIFATHFMVYNLCVYSLAELINKISIRISSGLDWWMMKPFDLIFYNKYCAPFSECVFGGGFEFFHLVYWMPWLFIAIKRLFNTVWWKNVLISYICSRLFFYLIFGVLKKCLIAFTIYTMH